VTFLRHCVECRNCRTRYLLAFSLFRNGSYLVRIPASCPTEYTLYCTCQTPAISSRHRENEVRRYVVTKTAHERGYGNSAEIVLKGAGEHLK